MDIVNCKNCGRLFNRVTGRRICPTCLGQLEDKFVEVKRYIEDNKNANIDTVSRECEVSVKQIKEWVKEERLSFAESSMDGVACEQCGKMILCGKFCAACKTKIANNLQSALDGKKPVEEKRQRRDRDKDRMRFLQGLNE